MTAASGAENHLAELCRAQQRLGWRVDVMILSPNPEALANYADRLRDDCRDVVCFRMPRDLAPALLLRLRSVLRSRRYAVVHSHLVHADWHLAVAARFAPKSRTAIVSTKHNHDPFRTRFPARAIETLLGRRFDATIAISESLRAFTSRWNRIRCEVVLYGLEPGGEVAPPPFRRPVHLLAIGRLVPQKGVDVLLEAARELRARGVHDFELHIAGDGPLREALEHQARDLGLDRHARFLGHRSDVPDLLADADALVHAARWEGFGLVLLEAMRASRPVVATRSGAVPEVVADDETGLLVSVDDAAGLADAIARIATTPGLGERLGRSGRERLIARFSPARMAAETLAVYERARTRAESGAARAPAEDGATALATSP